MKLPDIGNQRSFLRDKQVRDHRKRLERQNQEAACTVIQRVLAAYGSQRDKIGDSDLDNEQPVALNVHLTLGDIRRVRDFVIESGHRPADFPTNVTG